MKNAASPMKNATCGVFFAALAVVALLAAGAEAAMIFTEPFDYSTGYLPGNGGWSGTTNWDVESGNLSYPAGWNGMPSGNRATINGGGGAVTKSLGTTIDYDSSGTYYVSFLISKDSTPATGNEYFWMSLRDGTAFIKTTMGIGSSENVLLGYGTANGQFSISSTTVSGNTDYFYLAKIVTSGTGNDQLYAKVYDPSAPAPKTEPASWDVTRNSNITGSASLLRLESGSAAYYTLDEILIGDRWNEVVPTPEPSSLAILLGLGGLGLLGFRGRRSRASQ